ncbi:flagellar hook-basal body complex protein FliE [Bacillus niameyensis]|uniref:flagellar hook-basal body complex protein FliE n=1 Tax=Bacillus niameyensis TaxID=1522308 RepID=UPI000785C689|nr:flagellar hook-basal body complex protein FliE [Bacillus niameyensis]
MIIQNGTVANAQLFPIKNVSQNQVATTSKENSFGNMLKKAMDEVNQAQIDSSNSTQKLIQGENIELHDVMITAQKASITMQAALEIRNKAVEAYQEMMRMQV